MYADARMILPPFVSRICVLNDPPLPYYGFLDGQKVTATAHIPALFKHGHAISTANVMAATARAVVIPLCALLLLRPSMMVASLTCTTNSVLFAVVGYFSHVFDIPGVAIGAGWVFLHFSPQP